MFSHRVNLLGLVTWAGKGSLYRMVVEVMTYRHFRHHHNDHHDFRQTDSSP